MSWSSSAFGILLLALSSAGVSPVQAQLREDGTVDRQQVQRDTDVATRHCQDATLLRLRATYPDGQTVVWAAAARTLISFNHMVTVRGTGMVQEASLTGWRLFTYECAFMYQTRQSVMRLQVDSSRIVP